MPDLLRYWYLGSKARRHMMLRRFSEVDVEVTRGPDVAPAPSPRVLDIGSAWGYNVMALSRLGVRVVGMDLVVDPFGAGARIAAANGLDFHVVGGDASHLPFADGSFDAVTMVETFEHIYGPDRAQAAAECGRVLREGGILVLSTPNYGSLVERIKRIVVRLPAARRRLPTMCYPSEDGGRDEYHPYRYHRPEPVGKIAALIERRGFKVLKIKYFLFVLKNASDGWYRVQSAAERVAEKIPGVRRLAATVCFVAEKRSRRTD
jgi:SAM-dependent methyltransferase